MSRTLKKAFLFLLGLYIFSSLALVPLAQKEVLARNLTGIDKLFKPVPSGFELLLPALNYNTNSIHHINPKYPFEAETKINSVVIPVLPFIAYYENSIEIQSFKAGEEGFVFLVFSGAKFYKNSWFIT